MKKYIIPEIKINSFCVEDIITDSAAGVSAHDQMANELNTAGVKANYTMAWEKE